MNEIEIFLLGDAIEQCRRAPPIKLVPAHMRHFHARVARFNGTHLAANPTQARMLAMFQATVGQQLHADADAKKGTAGLVDELR